MDILQIDNLSKSFGTHKVIDDLSFTVPEHSVFGFLGQNGAGKTTTMKMVLGLLKPSQGNIRVCGETVKFGQTKTNRFVGYLPDVPEFYGYMKPAEYLKLCGEITGLTDQKIKSRSDELLTMVGLDNVNKKISGFSRGMKQRLGIAQALLNEPKLLICDEPTSALDPIGRKDILDILYQVKGKTTVVFSTHILADVERICDHIAVINEGKLALYGTISEIKAQHKQDGLLIEFASKEEVEQFLLLPDVFTFIAKIERTGNGIILHTHHAKSAESIVMASLLEYKLMPLKIEVMEPTIESLFMEVVK
ncbi:MAG: ABC transporter ATP-binding protein [Mobilitalea sp.]